MCVLIDDVSNMVNSHLLNSSRALVDDGTPFSGQERKWNCVTVRVSPVRWFFRPVAVAQLLSVLRQAREHDHDDAALLPHHLPEVRGCVSHRTGCGDVCWVARVVVSLKNTLVMSNFNYISSAFIPTLLYYGVGAAYLLAYYLSDAC